jgi:glycosyltransferase involved in cell wall biosynthesis
MQPVITVLMSCYNAEAWLPEAIDSVLSQTYRNFEFILIDDGSQDNTLAVLQDYEKSDDRIKVITKVNTGLSDSLNVGLNQAVGEWLARIDADDICEPTRLEKQLSFVQANPEVVLLGTGFLEIDAAGQPLKAHQYPAKHKLLTNHLETLKRFFPHSSAFYRTKVAQHVGGYNKRYVTAQDWDLWLRLSEMGQVACLPESLVKIRKHENQISRCGAGKTYMIEAQGAIIQYFLRKRNYDNLIPGAEDEWVKFHEWVEAQVDREGVFEEQAMWMTTRSEFLSRRNRIIGIVLFAKQLLYSGYAGKIVKEKFLGSDLPKRLAQQWVLMS